MTSLILSEVVTPIYIASLSSGTAVTGTAASTTTLVSSSVIVEQAPAALSQVATQQSALANMSYKGSTALKASTASSNVPSFVDALFAKETILLGLLPVIGVPLALYKAAKTNKTAEKICKEMMTTFYGKQESLLKAGERTELVSTALQVAQLSAALSGRKVSYTDIEKEEGTNSKLSRNFKTKWFIHTDDHFHRIDATTVSQEIGQRQYTSNFGIRRIKFSTNDIAINGIGSPLIRVNVNKAFSTMFALLNGRVMNRIVGINYFFEYVSRLAPHLAADPTIAYNNRLITLLEILQVLKVISNSDSVHVFSRSCDVDDPASNIRRYQSHTRRLVIRGNSTDVVAAINKVRFKVFQVLRSLRQIII